jgi:hypothetical protein
MPVKEKLYLRNSFFLICSRPASYSPFAVGGFLSYICHMMQKVGETVCLPSKEDLELIRVLEECCPKYVARLRGERTRSAVLLNIIPALILVGISEFIQEVSWYDHGFWQFYFAVAIAFLISGRVGGVIAIAAIVSLEWIDQPYGRLLGLVLSLSAFLILPSASALLRTDNIAQKWANFRKNRGERDFSARRFLADNPVVYRQGNAR